jgi:hypothetical protein
VLIENVLGRDPEAGCAGAAFEPASAGRRICRTSTRDRIRSAALSGEAVGRRLSSIRAIVRRLIGIGSLVGRFVPAHWPRSRRIPIFTG